MKNSELNDSQHGQVFNLIFFFVQKLEQTHFVYAFHKNKLQINEEYFFFERWESRRKLT